MSHIMLSQSQSASSLRYGEFKVSQAVMLQCGGEEQSTHLTFSSWGLCFALELWWSSLIF